jgi:hypothetical protein
VTGQFMPLAMTLGGLMLMLVIAALSPLALTRGAISFKPLSPDISRLFKLQGLTRMFSLEGLMELPRLLIKLFLIAGVGWLLVRYYRGDLIELPQQDLGVAMRDTLHVAGVAFLCMAAVMMLVAAVDVPLSLWQYARKHRMTKEEVRKEHRESEGDPHLKGRIRAMQRQATHRASAGGRGLQGAGRCPAGPGDGGTPGRSRASSRTFGIPRQGRPDGAPQQCGTDPAPVAVAGSRVRAVARFFLHAQCVRQSRPRSQGTEARRGIHHSARQGPGARRGQGGALTRRRRFVLSRAAE